MIKLLRVRSRDCSITRRMITRLGAPMSFMMAMLRIFSMVKVYITRVMMTMETIKEDDAKELAAASGPAGQTALQHQLHLLFGIV